MDLAKSRPDRVCQILSIRVEASRSPVHPRSQIARARADFDRFSAMSESLETGWPREISNCVLFLAAADASFVTGHALVVDGGLCAGTGNTEGITTN
jgi:NAD(P)-dependent dehydrogenase (short-subunit alcohol dehydrogenase family)